jgi:hypothetical protein
MTLFFQRALLGLIVCVSLSPAGARAENLLAPGVGLRALGMGGAFIALADDATASYWNPAGLPQLQGVHLLASLPFPDSLSLFYLQYYGASASFGGFGVGGIVATKTFLGEPTKHEIELAQLGVGGQLTRFFRAGISAKRYAQTLGATRTEGLGLDIALLIEPEGNFAVGLKAADIGGVTLDRPAPTNPPTVQEMTVQLGARVRLFDDHVRFGIGMEVTQGGEIGGFHFGIEAILIESFALRAGWNNGDLTVGAGVGIKNLFTLDALIVGQSWTVATELVLFGR